MRSKKSSILTGVVAACLLGGASPAPAGEFGDKIAGFAAAQVGKKVGDGHSTRLVEQAFAAAGAKPGRDLKWGTTDKVNLLVPGDIIQFRTDYKPKTGKSESPVFTNPADGSTWALREYTAVVEKAQGTKVTILYQNGHGYPVSENARVQRLELDLRWKISGTYEFYRPVHAPAWAELGPKIVSFAASRVDQKGVGDGQCTTLVHQAFAAAGAKPGKDYVWGAKHTGSALYPGDIIQFKSAVFKNGNSTWKFGLPNHTAIVEKAWGTKVTLLHQNVDGEPATEKSHVRRFELDVKWLKSGDYTWFEPVLK